MVSYYMVAAFATIYFLALVPSFYETHGHPLGSSALVSRYRKVASGFEESLAGFLDAMLLFSISMLVAAITRYSSLYLHPHKSHSIFGLQGCVFLSAFSIFPALILQCLSSGLQHRRIRLVMWDLVIFLTIAVEVLYRVEYRGWLESGHFTTFSSTASQLSQKAWWILCQSESLRQSLQTLLSVGHGVLLVNSAAWIYNIAKIYLHRWSPLLPKNTVLWQRWESCKLWLRLGNGLLCLCIMWTFLGFFTVYRRGKAVLTFPLSLLSLEDVKLLTEVTWQT